MNNLYSGINRVVFNEQVEDVKNVKFDGWLKFS